MNNNNLIYIVAIGIDLHEGIIKSWEYYCNKYNIDFKIIKNSLYDKRSPHWERYTIFQRFPNYENYIYIDTDMLVHWNAPNFFKTLKQHDDLCVVKDTGSLEWVYNSILGYKHFFPTVNLTWDNYFNSGFIKFSKKHKKLFENFLKFHDENEEEINRLQYYTLKKGFDQTPFNYFVTDQNIKYNIISEYYSLGHLYKKGILKNLWFLQVPCYIWHFNEVPKNQLNNFFDLLWDRVKHKYE
jgi:lipopolysaccharide biosynthesis glycosyltransferase